MMIQPTKQPVQDFDGDAIIVGAYTDCLAPTAEQLDPAISGSIERLKAAGEITGKRYETTRILAPAGVPTIEVVVVGLGKKDELCAETVYGAAATAAKLVAGKKRKKVGFFLDDFWPKDLSEQAIAGLCVGMQGQDLYRKEKALTTPEEIYWYGVDEETIEKGAAYGNAINLTRNLVNRPAADMYPATFAEEASVVAEDYNLSIEVWDKKKLEEERCGSLLAVSQASSRDPRLVIIRYSGGKLGESPLALVGKGVTFDSGGLSLKPSDGMKTMKCDMAGAATVLGAIKAIAALQLPINVVALVGLVENMVSGNSYKLGDVLTARSGKTIEVLNTDAEGRLVLADVLNVALEEKPTRIIDLATLTGACVVALGLDVAGLMTNDEPLQEMIFEAAKRMGEPMWPLPMYAEFGDQIKSQVADIKNIGEGRWGGAITAAKFLEEFVEGTAWTHIDIAGPAFLEKAKPWMDGGASGFGVRTLVEVVKTLCK